VHDIGLREVARLDAELKATAERSFGTSDVPALMQRLRTDRQYTFRTRQELIDDSKAALERARAAAPQWFGLLPKTDVRIEPYPAYREVSGAPGEYNPPRRPFTRRFRVITSRSRLASNAATFIRSGATFSIAATSRGGASSRTAGRRNEAVLR
jgi:uncharacterized protein (DUF885 family)